VSKLTSLFVRKENETISLDELVKNLDLARENKLEMLIPEWKGRQPPRATRAEFGYFDRPHLNTVWFKELYIEIPPGFFPRTKCPKFPMFPLGGGGRLEWSYCFADGREAETGVIIAPGHYALRTDKGIIPFDALATIQKVKGQGVYKVGPVLPGDKIAFFPGINDGYDDDRGRYLWRIDPRPLAVMPVSVLAMGDLMYEYRLRTKSEFAYLLEEVREQQKILEEQRKRLEKLEDALRKAQRKEKQERQGKVGTSSKKKSE